MNNGDTIAAISTPYGTGAVAIVRMSGPHALDIGSGVFRGTVPLEQLKDRFLAHGRIVCPDTGETADEVLAVKMKAPATYTGEDVVEIHCHGGLEVQSSILGLLLRQGARPAQPGEFTKRAFLNGRMDLSQAEAVTDLINARTGLAAKTAVHQLEGELSGRLQRIRKGLVSMLAGIEAVLDFPDEDIGEDRDLPGQIEQTVSQLEELLDCFEKGRAIREGISVVIAGRPNVGKSSLLNRLSGRDSAIVTHIPGTTRDILREQVSIEGIPVNVMDTAGIRDTEDLVERIGVDRTYDAAKKSDLVLLVTDARQGIGEPEKKLLSGIENTRHIVVMNKVDLLEDFLQTVPGTEGIDGIKTSMLDGTGVEELKKRVARMFPGGGDSGQEVLLTNARHSHLVDKAAKSLKHAVSAWQEGMPPDILTIDIREAAESLGEITGEAVSDAVLDEIFSRFCIGK